MDNNRVVDLILGLAEDCGTPRALTVAILVRAGEWAQLLKLRVEPRFYLEGDVYKLRKDLTITSFLRKCKLPWVDLDTRAEAVKTFWSCEAQNAETNSRLRRFLPSGFVYPGDEALMSFVDMVRKEIASVLPPVPRLLTPRFSGGATLSDKGRYITLPDKLTSRPTVYSQTVDLLENSFWSTAWGSLHVNLVPKVERSNKFFTVPKDTEKDRGCCKESSINVTLQLDAARSLRVALRRLGIDLECNQFLHSDLAREGSKNGFLATIDLSNASDTLSRVLVELLLPRQWYELLNSLRATHTNLDGRLVRLEKFSSMGNGFTFELETLIFACIARTVSKVSGSDTSNVWAYGDDLIVEARIAPLLCKTLAWLGFTPNWKKSFWEGLFRESCGGDFFNGVAVRPFHLEELPSEPHEIIALANGLRRTAFPYALKTWRQVVKLLPTNVRKCRGPEWLGDLVIHDIPSTWVTRRVVIKATNNFVSPLDPSPFVGIRVWSPIAEKINLRHWKPEVVLVGSLLGLPSDGPTPRDGVSGYKAKWIQLCLVGEPLPEVLPRRHPCSIADGCPSIRVLPLS